jgi:excisionase family DNA binding protein
VEIVDMANPDRLLTIPQAAQLLAISRQSVQRLIDRKVLRATHVGGLDVVRISLRELRKVM